MTERPEGKTERTGDKKCRRSEAPEPGEGSGIEQDGKEIDGIKEQSGTPGEGDAAAGRKVESKQRTEQRTFGREESDGKREQRIRARASGDEIVR